MTNTIDQSYTIATINVNAIQNPTKLHSLSAFIRMLDLDIVCMQEFACVHYELPGYEVILNIDERNGDFDTHWNEHFRHSKKLGLQNFGRYLAKCSNCC